MQKCNPHRPEKNRAGAGKYTMDSEGESWSGMELPSANGPNFRRQQVPAHHYSRLQSNGVDRTGKTRGKAQGRRSPCQVKFSPSCAVILPISLVVVGQGGLRVVYGEWHICMSTPVLMATHQPCFKLATYRLRGRYPSVLTRFVTWLAI